MNVTEYLQATQGNTVQGNATAATTNDSITDCPPQYHAQEEHSGSSWDDPKEDEVDEYDHDSQNSRDRFQDITASRLYGEIAQALNVDYLSQSASTNITTTTSSASYDDSKSSAGTYRGKLLLDHWIVALPCRRETPCPPGVSIEDLPKPKVCQIIFVIDTTSSKSYLSIEAMQCLMTTNDDITNTMNDSDDVSTNTIHDVMHMELPNGRIVECYLSPQHYQDVNVLGATIWKHVNLVTDIQTQEFTLTFVDSN